MSSRRNWMVYVLIAVILIVVVLGGMRMLDSGVAAAAAKLGPQQYVTDFAQTNSDHILIDVRTPAEFGAGAIPGAVNIPVESIEQRLNEIPDDKTVVLYCRSGNRSAQAAHKLAAAGFDDIYDLGGIIAWEAAGLPVE